MCECGCGLRNKYYRFPGPGEAFYLLTLTVACRNCCAPSGVCIQLCERGTFDFDYYSDDDHITGQLPFTNWGDSQGVAITTGMEIDQFTAAIRNHLIGVGAEMFGDNDAIDGDGADVIIEEMYEDAQTMPSIVVPEGATT